MEKKIEEAQEKLDIACNAVDWEVDSVVQQDLGSVILLEATVRFTIEKD